MDSRSKKKLIGQVLMESLTADQIAELLNAIFPSGAELDRLLELLETVNTDLASTIRTITGEGAAGDEARSGQQPVTSLQHARKRWEALWSQWEAHVLELGDDEGKYAIHENHWDPPYFDGYGLASDLETVAEKMLPLIDRVFEAVGEPALFLDTLARIEDGIKTYPEWMGAEYEDGCCLKRQATRCILHWCWLDCMKTADPAAIFVAKVIEIENNYEQVRLNNEATIDYLGLLPDATCFEIYRLLSSNKLNLDLDEVHSVWHRIHHQYQARFDSGRHLESCAAHLSENWRYGRPLVEASMGRCDWQAAESWLEKTFASLLGPRRQKTWFPESDLLVAETNTRFDIEAEEIVPLLRFWARTSRELGFDSRAAAAEFQASVFQEPENWGAVLPAYKDTVGNDPQSIIISLWEQWKTEMANRSMRYYPAKPNGATWIHWLLDAMAEGDTEAESFRNSVETWLETLKGNGAIFEKQWRWLALLTEDIDAEHRLEKEYPRFCRTALWGEQPGGRDPDPLASARREALAQMSAEMFLPRILTVWKQHTHRIVPDPSKAGKSNYTWNATWAAALQELNPSQFLSLIEKWRVKHHRRRNLWRDLKAQGLPV